MTTDCYGVGHFTWRFLPCSVSHFFLLLFFLFSFCLAGFHFAYGSPALLFCCWGVGVIRCSEFLPVLPVRFNFWLYFFLFLLLFRSPSFLSFTIRFLLSPFLSSPLLFIVLPQRSVGRSVVLPFVRPLRVRSFTFGGCPPWRRRLGCSNSGPRPDGSLSFGQMGKPRRGEDAGGRPMIRESYQDQAHLHAQGWGWGRGRGRDGTRQPKFDAAAMYDVWHWVSFLPSQ